jgi:hypothetical protein
MQQIYIGNTLVNDVYLGDNRTDVQHPFYYVGDYAFGGIIIKLNGTFPYYTGGIVASLTDAYSAEAPPWAIWGCSGTSITTSAAAGTGQANTNAILAGCATRPILASIADTYTEGGYSDWYLPSEGDNDLISAIYTLVPGLSLTQAYASSTETNTTQFRAKFMNGGTVNRSKSDTGSSIRIRACRNFSLS